MKKKPIVIKTHPVVSSNIISAGYDDASNTLQITYTNGSKYQYANVPPEMVKAMWQASSVGKFVRENIAFRYKYNRV